MIRQHNLQVRVRYHETDPMGLLHHSQYFVFFEMGRTELLRANGGSYRAMEQSGLFAVVVKAQCVFHQPARYDDLLTIRTSLQRVTPAKIEHEYHVLRDDQLLATGHVTLALVDRDGTIQRVPDSLLGE